MKEKYNSKMKTKGEKSYVKGLALSDFGIDGNPSVVDVKNGKILRIRPLHYDSKYDKKSCTRSQIVGYTVGGCL
jgi:trimethylamine-N-oxide reductase (cytochrome c)